AATKADGVATRPAAGTLPRLPGLSSRLQPAPTLGGAPVVSGPLAAPGGPFLYDASHRVVFLHGVNVVYKHPPFEVYPDAGKPWNFGAADASLMARLGFDVVRLGMTWRGLEPGTAPTNDRAICRPGKPGNPHQFDQAVFERYVRRLRQTVDLLGRYHIYSILDMHQDVYNQMFDGEGAPNWAVCTNGLPSVDPPGRWSLSYATAAAGVAYQHFWDNNVVGNLQGQFDMVWGKVAAYFRNDPWVVGYDPFNEPFSASLVRLGDEHFDAQLECFYTGTAHIGRLLHGAPPINCSGDVPAQGVIPTILANDPRHLVFPEPDNYASRGFPTFLGPMNFPNLVYNVHIYCGARSPVTGNPTDIAACAAQEARSLARRSEDRREMASAIQKAGPAWMVTEFGASSDPSLLSVFTDEANSHLVGWSYWAWRYYADPTGSAAESLVMSNGRLRSTARVLSQTYPEAVAGRPTALSFDPTSGAFRLAYVPSRAATAPTVVFVPTAIHYPNGYCARVTGATVVSRTGSTLLEVRNRPGSRSVRVRVTAGRCRR
ncbi:MAG: cellulase family glycosylhydrolase, partial [Acidimicrobiales bacterium]